MDRSRKENREGRDKPFNTKVTHAIRHVAENAIRR